MQQAVKKKNVWMALLKLRKAPGRHTKAMMHWLWNISLQIPSQNQGRTMSFVYCKHHPEIETIEQNNDQ